MSLLRATPLARLAAPRTSAIATTPRLFSTTIQRPNIVKETVQKVNQVVSDQLAKGIEKGAELKEGTQAALNSTAEQVKEQASKISDQVQGKASKLTGRAKGAAAELQGQVKGKAEELKGKAEEVKGEVKAKAEEVKGEAQGKVEEAKEKLS